jgi:hypothetical protein
MSSASDKEIRTVKVKWDALFWTLLGFDCEVESIEHPEDFPLCYFTLAHRKRIAVYVNSCKNKPETEEVKVARCYLKHHLPIYEWVRLRRGVDF